MYLRALVKGLRLLKEKAEGRGRLLVRGKVIRGRINFEPYHIYFR